MAGSNDVKYRLSGGVTNTSKGSSLGGAMSTDAAGGVTSSVPENLFLGIPANDTVLGRVYYRCFYIRNGNTTEKMKDVSFFMQSKPNNPNRSDMSWAFGTSPINGVEQGPFADQNTSPANVDWKGVQNAEPKDPNIGDLSPLDTKAIWVRLTLLANASDKRNDNSVFLTRGKIATGGAAPGPDDPGGGIPPSAPSAFNFVSVGDWDMNSMTKKVVASMEKENPEVCVDLGDHAYKAGENNWLSGLKSLKSKLLPTVGNHDSTNTVKNQFGFQVPFSVDRENVHFLSINTETSMGSSSNQRSFVKEDLKKARENSAIDWIVVFMHKPFYTADSKHPPNENGQVDAFGADMDKYKVDLVLQAHNHSMQRTYPVKFNSSNKTDPIIAQTGNGPYTKGDGTVFCICGTGGHDSGNDLYSIDSDEDWNAFTNDNDNGYMNIVLSGTDNSIMSVFFKDENGDTLHSFIIQ